MRCVICGAEGEEVFLLEKFILFFFFGLERLKVL